jgi:30S ribosomal protein S31
MGRGDKRTKRGKITIGSFGKVRPAKTAGKKPVEAAKADAKS